MATIYDGVFRTILNDCRKGVGDMMSGALIETSARKLINEAENDAKKDSA